MKIAIRRILAQGVITLLIGLVTIPVLAQEKPEKALTKADLKDWFETRIYTHELQLEYKANAEQYDDLVVAYFEGRNEWLKEQGKDPEEWDKLSERVHAVYSMMEEQKSIDEERVALQEQLKEIDNNEYMNAEQKQQMKDAMTATLDKRQELNHLFVDDWPAAKLYSEEYYQLDLWISGNAENPPVIK
jgi:regulator of replication initiation timing